jgi:hypothetical protein
MRDVGGNGQNCAAARRYAGVVKPAIGGAGAAAYRRANKGRREGQVAAVEVRILGDVQRPVEVALAGIYHRNGELALHRISRAVDTGSGLFLYNEVRRILRRHRDWHAVWKRSGCSVWTLLTRLWGRLAGLARTRSAEILHNKDVLLAILYRKGRTNAGEGGVTEHIFSVLLLLCSIVYPTLDRILNRGLVVERRHPPRCGLVLEHRLGTEKAGVLRALAWSCAVPTMNSHSALRVRIWSTRHGLVGCLRRRQRQKLRISLRGLIELVVHLQGRLALACAKIVHRLKYALNHVGDRVRGRTAC